MPRSLLPVGLSALTHRGCKSLAQIGCTNRLHNRQLKAVQSHLPMYAKYFDLKQEPFSIAPDPRYLFMSERHREALAHLLYGVNGGGGFVVLTGEIGAGKTTVCRCFLEQIPRRCNVAYIFNPKQTVLELLQSICDEFRIPYRARAADALTVKDFVDPLNEFLLRTHAVGQNNVLIIDEAQNLSVDVLEQLRLLTNLETAERKLLQIILIGQPELRSILARPELEQLAQRVIARFHLLPLSETETSQYIWHRLTVAGKKRDPLFDVEAIRRIHHHTRGVPRRINLLCDRALLGAYAQGKTVVDRSMVDKAAAEVFDLPLNTARLGRLWRRPKAWVALIALLVLGGAGFASWKPGRSWTWGQQTAQAANALLHAQSSPHAPQRLSAATGPAPSSATSSPASSHPSGQEAGVDASEWLNGLPAQALLDDQPLSRLAQLWQLPPMQGDVCESVKREQLRCFNSDAGLSLLRLLDRPSVLTLVLAHREVRVLLTGLDEHVARLSVGNNAQAVTLDSLAHIWRGEFTTLWRVPVGYHGKIVPGQTGEAADWLREQMAKLESANGVDHPQAGSLDLQTQIHAFQVMHGLKSDGVAGSTTFMVLNRFAGIAEPRLSVQP